jgi:hypothetical protein
MQSKYMETEKVHSLVYSLKLAFGLALIMEYNVIFKYLLDNKIVSQIHYMINRDNIIELRPNYPEVYITDMRKACDFIFSDSRIVQKEELDACAFSPQEIISRFSIPKNLILDNRHLITEEPIIKDEYITINTKTNEVFNTHIESMLPYVIEILKRSKYRIVLIGEKNITPCIEYDIHKQYINCIYTRLLDANLNYIDMTYENTYNGYSIEAIKKSMNICKYSKCNIVFNSSGALTLSLSVGNTHVILTNIDGIKSRSYVVPNLYHIIHDIYSFLDYLTALIV